MEIRNKGQNCIECGVKLDPFMNSTKPGRKCIDCELKKAKP